MLREAPGELSAATALQAACTYTRRGYRVLPLPAKTKIPTLKGWTELRLSEDELPAHFDGRPSNVSILTGEPSGGLVDIDLDAREAVGLAPSFLPATELVSGRASSARSHYWYKADPLLPTAKFRDPTVAKDDQRSMLVELRSTGCQTVVPPSLHPTGEQIVWHQDGEPATVDGNVLLADVRRLAAAALLARHWPATGSRQDAALALAGMLLRGGWSDGDTAAFIHAVAGEAGDEEARKRADSAGFTRNRLEADKTATGAPRLAELLGQPVVERVREWLGLLSAISSPGSDGLVKRLADAILQTDHFAQDAGGKLYVYSGGAYRPSGQGHVRRRVKELLLAWQATDKWSSHRAEEVAEFLRVDAPELWPRPPLDALCLSNGLLRLSSGELVPHDPGWLSPVQLPVVFDVTATCPAWESFIADVFPSDAAELAWQVVAWLMTPDASIQKAILLLGEGSNGKSTFLAALVAFLGSRNTAALSLHKLESDRFAAARLLGKLANVCSDLPSEHLAGTSMFKALTGGDRIPAEYKYRDLFEFDPFARLIFSANHPPRSEDATHAFFRRWLVIPFGRTFDGTDRVERRDLDAALAAPLELSGVLNRALAALPALRANGFLESASVQRAWVEFRQATDPLAVWLDRATVEKVDAYVSRDDLRRAYYADCVEHGRPPLSPKAFGQALKRLRPNVIDGQRTIAGERVWCYIGLGLLQRATDRRRTQDAQDAQDALHCYPDSGQCPEGGERTTEIARGNNKSDPVHPVHPVPVESASAAREPAWLPEADFATQERWRRGRIQARPA